MAERTKKLSKARGRAKEPMEVPAVNGLKERWVESDLTMLEAADEIERCRGRIKDLEAEVERRKKRDDEIQSGLNALKRQIVELGKLVEQDKKQRAENAALWAENQRLAKEMQNSEGFARLRQILGKRGHQAVSGASEATPSEKRACSKIECGE
ncbi:hypothetical protein BSKO_11106 [Bryopsis sp. KO-2023]|nr:hypothetical protein BSKO_11106 [Bryopsis sp. KO-2023]